MITIDNLKKQFGETIACDIPAFTINDGDILGLVGNNGAGKTTLFRMILDLLKPDQGTVSINNINKYAMVLIFTLTVLISHILSVTVRFLFLLLYQIFPGGFVKLPQHSWLQTVPLQYDPHQLPEGLQRRIRICTPHPHKPSPQSG